MKTENKPSKGAMEAAEAIKKHIILVQGGFGFKSLAQIIDEKTGVRELVEALKWYADFAGTTEIEYDCGKRARAVLAKYKEGK
jgi:hypothetical protein